MFNSLRRHHLPGRKIISDKSIPFETQLEKIWTHIRGFHVLHLIDTGARLGFFEALAKAGEEGLGPEDLATPRGLHLAYVQVWWRTALAWEILEPAGDGKATLGPHLESILARPGDPRYLLPYVQGSIDHFGPDMRTHADLMTTGGVHPFQEHGKAFTCAIGAMTEGLHALVTSRILPSIDPVREALAGGGTLLDVGCGAGRLALLVAKAFPAARVTGTDVYEDAIGEARANIAEAKLTERIDIQDARSWKGEDGSFDVATMVEVLHEIPIGIRGEVLASCRRLLRPGGKLVILDETYPSNEAGLREPEAALAVQTQFNEMTWGNVVPTQEDQDRMLSDAGFEPPQRDSIGGIFSLLIASVPKERMSLA